VLPQKNLNQIRQTSWFKSDGRRKSSRMSNLRRDPAKILRAFFACSRGLASCPQKIIGATLSQTNMTDGATPSPDRIFV
jgi:hypothetical protein